MNFFELHVYDLNSLVVCMVVFDLTNHHMALPEEDIFRGQSPSLIIDAVDLLGDKHEGVDKPLFSHIFGP